MKLKEAYRRVVKDGDVQVFGSTQVLWNARAQVKRGELPSVELMRERVKLAGYNRVREEDWQR